MVLSTLLQNRVVLFPTSEPRGSTLSFRAAWSPPSPPKPCGPPYYFGAAWSLLYFRAAWSLLTLWLPGLGLNPSTHLPLQPHLRLLLQSATPASIPVFFQLDRAAIVSLGRCGPMAQSQSSPSSHTGSVTRGSCFPVTSCGEVTPSSLDQSMATAI